MRGGSAGNYCYYTEPMGEAQGRQVYTSLPDGEFCVQAKAADGKTYYLPCTISGIISANPSGSMVNTSDAWYTISGMKLGTQPRQKGVYIYKGNKVVIK